MVSGLAGFLLFTLVFTADSTWKTVFAAEAAPVETGTEAEGGNGGEVYQTVLPADTEHVFDFIMDPQKLISRTNAAAYGNCTFEEGATLFFRRSDGECEEDYRSSSDALVISNRGTADVDIVLTAGISSDSMGGITLTDDRDFTEDTGASLYLALTDGEHTALIDGEEGASLHAVLKGRSEENGEECSYRFWLTGAVNENGDWSEVKDAVPKVTVTWSVTKKETAPVNQEEKTDQKEDGVLPDEQNAEAPRLNENQGAGKLPENQEGPGGNPASEEDADRKEQKPSEASNPEAEDSQAESDSREAGEENTGDQNRSEVNENGENQPFEDTEDGVSDQEAFEENGNKGMMEEPEEKEAQAGDEEPEEKEAQAGDEEPEEKEAQNRVEEPEEHESGS